MSFLHFPLLFKNPRVSPVTEWSRVKISPSATSRSCQLSKASLPPGNDGFQVRNLRISKGPPFSGSSRLFWGENWVLKRRRLFFFTTSDLFSPGIAHIGRCDTLWKKTVDHGHEAPMALWNAGESFFRKTPWHLAHLVKLKKHRVWSHPTISITHNMSPSPKKLGHWVILKDFPIPRIGWCRP